jgi:O-antigen/teichoic acid export membrane protein
VTGARKSIFQSTREGVRRPGTVAVLMGSLASGVGAYLFQVVGTRTLGGAAFAPIGVLWTIHYLALTIGLISIEAHVARTLTVQDDEAAARRALVPMSVWVATVAVVLGAATYLAREPLFGGQAELALVVAVTVAGYGVFVLVRGWLAGSYRFRLYGVATALESLGRLAAALVVAWAAGGTRALAWTLALGPWAVAVWWLMARRSRTPQAPPEAQAELPPLAAASAPRYLAATTSANAASQTLLAAGPLVLLPLGAGPAEVSVFFVTVTAARVPLVFAFNGVLSRVLPALVRAVRRGEHDRLRRLAVGIVTGTAVLAVSGGAAGAWAGPAVVAAFFGGDFRPEGWFVALTVAGVVCATAALGLNQLLIAMGAEARLVGPWLLALACGAATVLLTAGSPSFRVILAFALSEVVALTGLAVAVLAKRKGREPV